MDRCVGGWIKGDRSNGGRNKLEVAAITEERNEKSHEPGLLGIVGEEESLFENIRECSKFGDVWMLMVRKRKDEMEKACWFLAWMTE